MPLPEVIGAALGHSSASKAVQREYEKLLKELGPEFSILREIPVEEIRRSGGRLIAEGIRRLREGKVERVPGVTMENTGRSGFLRKMRWRIRTAR